MVRQQRLEMIKEISLRRESEVLCYITGDRENVSTRIAPDVMPVIYRHLKMMKRPDRVDLFLYTRGGDVLTPWRLVHLIREFVSNFSVLIPFRAYSAGTLICLGADEILMGKMGELGPVDPSVVNAFNPQDPANPAARIPVNIEDVFSYLSLARDKAFLQSEEGMVKAFTLLTERIHPVALGNVHRNYHLIRSLSAKMLRLRKNPPSHEESQHIIDNLTEKLYAHNYMVARREAKEDIGLPVVCPDHEMEELLWSLYEDYAKKLKLGELFDPAGILHGTSTDFEVEGGIIESLYGLDSFVFSGIVERHDFPEGGKINVNILRQGWRTRR